MMDLLMRLNERLSEIEQALEKALQEKQGELTSQPPEVSLTVTTAPSTLIIAVPPTVLALTIKIITGAISTATAPGKYYYDYREINKDHGGIETPSIRAEASKREIGNG